MDIITSIFAFAAIVSVLFAYRLGFKDGSAAAQTGEFSQIVSVKKKAKRHKESDEERKMRIELENIENYGTAIPQQEVE